MVRMVAPHLPHAALFDIRGRQTSLKVRFSEQILYDETTHQLHPNLLVNHARISKQPGSAITGVSFSGG